METNWAGNLTYSTQKILAPRSKSALQEQVAAESSLRALGTRHAFNTIADSDACLVSLAHLNQVIAINPERRQVTVEAGIRYGELSQALHAAGFALPNLASLPHISVAGAVATATHGSGDENGCLSTAVSAVELCRADGSLKTFSRENDSAIFPGVVASLGALGVVTQLTLDLLPTFSMRQFVYEGLAFERVFESFDAIFSSAYSVSLFTNWSQPQLNQLWRKERVTETNPSSPAEEFFGAPLATTAHHPIAGVSAESCTAQLGVIGPWHERLPHFRLDFTPSHGDELQTEYLVPRHHAVEALQAVANLGTQLAETLLISEVRTIAADDLWLSPFYQQACVALHFTWKPDTTAVFALLPILEAKLAPFGARPHWGKLFTVEPAVLQNLFPKLAAFRQLRAELDPAGKFDNAFLSRYLAPAS